MPLFSATVKETYRSNEFKNVKISYLDWFCNTLCLESENRYEVLKLANRIIEKYNNYSDLNIDLVSKTTENHNAVTLISKKEKGKYKLFIVFRNNRTTEEYLDGIFHAHKENHNIKKEGIGLIEVLGLFVLPPRLYREFNEINAILTGETDFDISKLSKESSLYIHREMISKLIELKSDNTTKEEADILIKNYALKTCANILNDISVFKNTSNGEKALEKFLNELAIIKGE